LYTLGHVQCVQTAIYNVYTDSLVLYTVYSRPCAVCTDGHVQYTDSRVQCVQTAMFSIQTAVCSVYRRPCSVYRQPCAVCTDGHVQYTDSRVQCVQMAMFSVCTQPCAVYTDSRVQYTDGHVQCTAHIYSNKWPCAVCVCTVLGQPYSKVCSCPYERADTLLLTN